MPSVAHSNRAVTISPYLLVAASGVVDGTCFLRFRGVFATALAGDLAQLGISLGTGVSFALSARFFVALGASAVGAGIAGVCQRRLVLNRGVLVSIALLGAVLVNATMLAAISDPEHSYPFLLIVLGLLAAGAGIQTIVVRAQMRPGITVNTAAIAGIVADYRGSGPDARLWRQRVLAVVVFVGAAAVGAATSGLGVAWSLLLAVVLVAIAVPQVRTPADPESESGR